MNTNDKSNEERPVIVSEFRIQLPDDHKLQMIEEYNTCSLCGSDLFFTHVANFVSQIMDEEAICQCCNIRQIKQIHRLQ